MSNARIDVAQAVAFAPFASKLDQLVLKQGDPDITDEVKVRGTRKLYRTVIGGRGCQADGR